MFSKFFTWNKFDLIKGAIVLLITTVLSTALQSLEAGILPTLPQLKAALITGAIASLSYMIKNLLTNVEGKFLKVTQKKNEPIN